MGSTSEYGDETRDIYLYDTFAGMTEPTDADAKSSGAPARPMYEKAKMSDGSPSWCRSTLEEYGV